MKEDKYHIPCRACKQFIVSMENLKLARETEYGKEWKIHTEKYRDILMDTSDHDLRDNSFCIIIQHKNVTRINKEVAEECK